MVYIVPPQFQLPPATPTSPFDCTAYSAAVAARYAKTSQSGPSGRTIRLLSDEPHPDPRSPGLNLNQVADVLAEHYGVFLDVHVGPKALTWGEYEAKRAQGRGALLQVSYAPIADSRYDAGRGFRDNHCIWEDAQATDDPLADGRAKGVYDRLAKGPIVYDRAIVKHAASMLNTGSHRAGADVWCAFTRDTVPVYRMRIKPASGQKTRAYHVFRIANGVIVSDPKNTEVKHTGGFESACSIPKAFRWPTKDRLLHELVQVKPDPGDPNLHVGEWVNAAFARET